MIDGLPVSILNGIGVVGVVLLIFWLIARGHLVTRREHQYVVAQVEKAEKERDTWKVTALRALGVAEQITGPVEIVADVMTRLPDPATEEEMS